MNKRTKSSLTAKSAGVSRRLHVILVLTVSAFAVLSFRLWSIQIYQHKTYVDKARNNHVREIPIPSQRGEILDRNGIRLAYDDAFYDIWVPIIIKGRQRAVTPEMEQTLRILAKYLKKESETEEEHYEKLVKEYKFSESDTLNKHYRVRIAKNVQYAKITPIEVRRNIEFPEEAPVHIETVQKRIYPKQDLAAHVLGYTNEIGKRQLALPKYADYTQGDMIGIDGIEKQYESYLRGKDGVKQVFVDRFEIQRGKASVLEKPVQGHNVVLNIDYKLQWAAERALGASRGVIIISDPRDNSIMAMASNPRFNPNNVSRDMREYQNAVGNPLYHRAVKGLYEPGSVIKVFESFALMEELGYTAEHSERCIGQFPLGNRFIHCHKREGHGVYNLTNAIRQSCNVYYYRTIKELGFNRLHLWMTKFGFNEKSGVDLPYESYAPYPVSRKYSDLIYLSIGQGNLTLNPLQIQTALCAIANGGKLYRPRVAKKILPPEERNPDADALVEFLPEEVPRMIEAATETFETIQHAMWEVVNNIGTGRRVKNSDFVLAGKTGTAQTSGPDTHAWFVCYGPYEDPTIAITILAEHSGHGGENASILLPTILEEYLSRPVIAQIDQEPEITHVDN